MTSSPPPEAEENRDESAEQTARYGEQEPLLGRVGDASQADGEPLLRNLSIGTGIIAEAGVIILVAIVWGAILRQDLMLFSAHPLLNSMGILFLTQGILILQPTHTPNQKRSGTLAHASINGVALLLLLVGLIVIVVNKYKIKHAHFDSPHSILGLTTYLFLLVQALIGFTQYWVPQLYGGVDNAKKVWKYHRASGYVVLVLLLVTVGAATFTDLNVGKLHIKLWAVIVSSVILLAGVLPRVKKQKFGF